MESLDDERGLCPTGSNLEVAAADKIPSTENASFKKPPCENMGMN